MARKKPTKAQTKAKLRRRTTRLNSPKTKKTKLASRIAANARGMNEKFINTLRWEDISMVMDNVSNHIKELASNTHAIITVPHIVAELQITDDMDDEAVEMRTLYQEAVKTFNDKLLEISTEFKAIKDSYTIRTGIIDNEDTEEVDEYINLFSELNAINDRVSEEVIPLWTAIMQTISNLQCVKNGENLVQEVKNDLNEPTEAEFTEILDVKENEDNKEQ